MDLDDGPEMLVERPLSPRARLPPIDPEQLTRNTEESRHESIDNDIDYQFPAPQPVPLETLRNARSRHSIAHSRTKRLSTSNKSGLPLNILPSAPASPPTPAPSPTPFQRAPSWTSAGENEDSFLRDARGHFHSLNAAERQRYLTELLNMCDSNLLSFVHHFVSPRLKKDPFEHLPDELCLRVGRIMMCKSQTNKISGSLLH
jgi:F-box and WD-40 domain protein CDC4